MELWRVVRLLDSRGVDPDVSFASAAGIDYGSVRVWALDDGKHLVAWGDNGETNHIVSDDFDADEIHEWLIPDDNSLSSVDMAAIRANVMGIDAIQSASASDKADEYAILETHFFNGPREDTAPIGGYNNADYFDTYAAAAEWIAEQESEVYRCGHNESGRPRYTIIPA